MIFLVLSAWTFLRAVFGDAASVGLENVALRYQLVVLERSVVQSVFSIGDDISVSSGVMHRRLDEDLTFTVAPRLRTVRPDEDSEDFCDGA